jgi:hypothetical protein
VPGTDCNALHILLQMIFDGFSAVMVVSVLLKRAGQNSAGSQKQIQSSFIG